MMYFLSPAYAFELFGHEVKVDVDWSDPASVVVGAALGAGVAFAFGTGVGEAAIGAAVVGAIVVEGANRLLLHNSDDSAVATGGKTPTKEELLNDTDVTSTFGDLKSQVDEEAVKDLAALRQSLTSSLTTYDIEAAGSLADIRVSVKGADKIYGYSCFPTTITIYAPCSDDPSENKVHITSIKAYVKDVETGQKWWVSEWTGDKILRNDEYTWEFMLKSPDPQYGKINNMMSGVANKEILDEVLNSEVPKYEIHYEVSGYREVWVWKTITDEDGTVREVSEHDRDDSINVDIKSLSAYLHESSGIYTIDGSEGSLPAKFAGIRTYTSYKMLANGATSNIISRVWATPCHILGSTADYKVYVLANPSYLSPLDASINDDFKLLTFRVQKDGTSSIASQVQNAFGDLSTINGFATSLNYNGDDNTVDFQSYVIVLAKMEVNDASGSKSLSWSNRFWSMTSRFNKSLIHWLFM